MTELKGRIVGTIALSLAAAVVYPKFMTSRANRQLDACTFNYHGLATAVEMYSTDFRGLYPATLSQLTPNYLRSLPTCPASGLP